MILIKRRNSVLQIWKNSSLKYDYMTGDELWNLNHINWNYGI
ncbi:hypothetical protein [Morganella morganii IS15]|nr:hypothetical protein [Morganella morganii IS15]